MTYHDVALIVNAGGTSRRMGSDKALLRMPDTDLVLVEHIVRRLRGLVTDRLIVVENNQDLATHITPELNVSYVEDIGPDLGPLGGLIPALELCREWAMVVACDMPHVRQGVFELLLATLDSGCVVDVDAVVPVAQGRVQPLHALYHRRCSAPFRTAIGHGLRSVYSALQTVRARYVNEFELRQVDPQFESFININTPEEWEAYKSAMD